MGFIGSVAAWIAASLVAYVLAAILSQTVVLNELAAIDTPMPFDVRLASTWHAVLNMPLYLAVILIGYAIAFYIARLVKALVPVLSPVAYPVAGAAAIWVALSLMKMQFGTFPILGAQETYGLVLQLLAGAAGGLVFEGLRPKR